MPGEPPVAMPGRTKAGPKDFQSPAQETVNKEACNHVLILGKWFFYYVKERLTANLVQNRTMAHPKALAALRTLLYLSKLPFQENSQTAQRANASSKALRCNLTPMKTSFEAGGFPSKAVRNNWPGT